LLCVKDSMSWCLTVSDSHICINCGLSEPPLIFSWLYFIWYSIVSLFFPRGLNYVCGQHGNLAIRSDRFASGSRFCHQAHSRLAWLMMDRATLGQIFWFPLLAIRPSNPADITLENTPLPLCRVFQYASCYSILTYFKTFYRVSRLQRVEWPDGKWRMNRRLLHF
jgi:hypothetical protein